MCKKCEGLMTEFKIELPYHLKNAINFVRKSVEDGIISDDTPTSYEGPFSALAAGGPWDDLVSYRFKCNHCGQLFELCAETYHGSGGSWTPVKKS